MYTSSWEANIFQDARKLASTVYRIMQDDWQSANDPRLQARLLAIHLVKLDDLLERWLEIESRRQQGTLEDMPSSPQRRSTYPRFRAMPMPNGWERGPSSWGDAPPAPENQNLNAVPEPVMEDMEDELEPAPLSGQLH